MSSPLATTPPYHKHLTKQLLIFIIKDFPFPSPLSLPPTPLWTPTAVIEVLRSIARFAFNSPRSISRQSNFRHRPLLRQRNLIEEQTKLRKGILFLGPAGRVNPYWTNLGLRKSLEFFRWVEDRFLFAHDEVTCREMAWVLARGGATNVLWDFLREMSKFNGENRVTTATITCLIKVLGEQGLGNEALLTFYRMKQYRCKPDVQAYNALMYALCRVGNFPKARGLFQQMELPGFRCSPDAFTYTILISSYCRYGMLTGCRKAVRRRLYEAGRLFRLMLFKGIVPDVVTYNALIDGCCKTYRIQRAWELFEDMKKRGCVPNRVTYDSLIRYYSAVNEIDRAIEILRDMQRLKHGLPGCSSYTPIIHALCEAGRVVDAWSFLVELVNAGFVPREYTYRLVCDALRVAGEDDLLGGEVHKRIKDGIWERYRGTMKVKPLMTRKGYPDIEEI